MKTTLAQPVAHGLGSADQCAIFATRLGFWVAQVGTTRLDSQTPKITRYFAAPVTDTSHHQDAMPSSPSAFCSPLSVMPDRDVGSSLANINNFTFDPNSAIPAHWVSGGARMGGVWYGVVQ